MRKFFTVCLPVAVLLFSNAAARAETLDFSLTGNGQTLTFSLPSSPTLSSHYFGGFTVADVATSFNGTPQTLDLGFDNTIFPFFFGTTAIADPMDGDLAFGSPADLFSGDSLFTGSGNAPVFNTGTFSESPVGSGVPYSLTITVEATPTAVPEPSSLLLFGTGIAGLAGTGRRRFFRRS